MSMAQTRKWFGNIPDTWRTVPLWTVLRPRKNKNSEGAEQNLLSLSYGKIKRKDIETKTGLLPESFNGYNIIEPGDIVLRLTDLQNDMRSLRTGLAKEHGIITSAYLTLFPYRNDSSEYLQYLLHCYDIMKGFYNMGEGIRQGLGYDELAKLSLCLPAPAEQSRIAAYLDDRCAKIDEAIARHQTLIGKLDEYRKAVINSAVTKGIKSNQDTKESGVEWLGRVPCNWTVCKLKYRIRLINGRAYSEPELLSEGKYRVLRVGNLFTNEKWYYSNLELEPNKYCERGDLLYAWSASFGPLIWNEDKVIYHYHIWKTELKNINKGFCFYLLSALTESKRSDAHGTAMVHITMASMNDSYIVVPSPEEQQEIAVYLDKKCAAIDSAKERHSQLIAKLEEYKKSLIYNAVTGKIEC